MTALHLSALKLRVAAGWRPSALSMLPGKHSSALHWYKGRMRGEDVWTWWTGAAMLPLEFVVDFSCTEAAWVPRNATAVEIARVHFTELYKSEYYGERPKTSICNLLPCAPLTSADFPSSVSRP